VRKEFDQKDFEKSSIYGESMGVYRDGGGVNSGASFETPAVQIMSLLRQESIGCH